MFRQSSRFLRSSTALRLVHPASRPGPWHGSASFGPSLQHLQLRCFNVDRRLRNQTKGTLSSRYIPLGTMTRQQIEATIESIDVWTKKGVLDLADLLVNRLGFELTSVSRVAQQYQDIIVDVHFYVILNGYLHHFEQEQRASDLERAERLLRRVTWWYQSGIIDPNAASASMLLEPLLALVQSWLKLPNQEGRGAALLRWWTLHYPSSEHQEEILPLFDDILDKSFDTNNTSVIVDVTSTMKELHANHGWTNVGSYEDYRLRFASENPAQNEGRGMTAEEEGRAIGLNILKTKIIEFLKDAKESDLTTVQQYKHRLQRLYEFSLTPDICQSFLDFYIRIKDSKEATEWLQRLDVATKSDQSSVLTMFQKFAGVLQLLRDDDKQLDKSKTPWRATELVRRMEELEQESSEQSGAMTTDLYNLYMSLWVESKDSMSCQKIEEIYEKMLHASIDEGRSELAPNKKTYELIVTCMSYSAPTTVRALSLVVQQWRELDREIRQDQLGRLMKMLAKWGFTDRAAMLLNVADRESDLTVTEDILADLVLVYANSPNPKAAFSALDHVKKRLDGKLPVVCCSSAMKGFVRNSAKGPFESQLTHLIISEASQGSLVVTNIDDAREIFELATSKMAKQQRSSELSKIVHDLVKAGLNESPACLDFLSTKCFNSEMKGWRANKAAHHLIASFEQLQELYKSGQDHLKPDKDSFRLFLSALAAYNTRARLAENTLAQLLEEYQREQSPDLKPTLTHFNSVLQALNRESPPDVTERSMILLNKMKEFDLDADIVTYNAVLSAILKSTKGDKFAKVMEIRRRMKEGGAEANLDTYNSTVEACFDIMSKQEDVGGALDEVLNCMEAAKFEANYMSYFNVLEHLLKAGNLCTGDLPYDRLFALANLQESKKHSQLAPKTFAYFAIIDAWIQGCLKVLGVKPFELLDSIRAEYSARGVETKPNAFIYDTVLHSLATKTKEDALSAHQLLQTMEEHYRTGDADLKPTKRSYSSVLRGLAKNGEVQKAETLLQKMIGCFNAGEKDLQPDNDDFAIVFSALAKSDGGADAAERAEAILEQIYQLETSGLASRIQPDQEMVNHVLHAWARSGSPMAPMRVEQLVDQMESLYRDGKEHLKPNKITYNLLVNTWGKSEEQGAPARAEEVMSIMRQRSDDGDLDLRPDDVTYLQVVNAWGRSKERNAHRNAYRILKQMHKTYERYNGKRQRPTIGVANAVINACASAAHKDDHDDALQTALQVYHWIKSEGGLEANSHTYSALLVACQLSDGAQARHDRAKHIFGVCCKDGWVNAIVLDKLRQVIDDDAKYSAIVGDEGNLPESWNRKHERRIKSSRSAKK